MSMPTTTMMVYDTALTSHRNTDKTTEYYVPHEFLPSACEWQTVPDPDQETERGNVIQACLVPRLSEASRWSGPSTQHNTVPSTSANTLSAEKSSSNAGGWMTGNL